MVSMPNQGCFCQKWVGSWPDTEISARNADRFYHWAADECARAADLLVIDLARVEYVSAAGLTAMLRVAKLAVLQEIRVIWKNVNPNIARLIRLAGLDKVILIAPQPTP